MNDSLIEASKPVETIRNPFKGLHSYEEKDQDDFSGRELDIKELFNLVTTNVHAMIYGRSGIGKTSLFQAGLFPRLRETHYFPVSVRLNYSSSIPFKNQIIQRIQEELKIYDIQKLDKGSVKAMDSFRKEETLWKYFSRMKYLDKENNLLSIVLILDQFEEIFTIGKNHPEREELAEELECLIEKQVAEKPNKNFLAVGGIHDYKIRIVLGLREDYLPHMDWLKKRIPSLFRVNFRVLPLNGTKARLVMAKYDKFRDTTIQQSILSHFHSQYSPPEKTMDDENLEVEPSILSLLCYQMVEKGITSLSEKEKSTVLSDFYDEEVRKIEDSQKLAKFIETQLLTDGGFRTSFYLAQNHPIRKSVEEAVNRRILRKVYPEAREHVEIIHDVLVPTIIERRNCRWKENEQKKLRRKHIFYQSIAIVGLLFIFLGIYAFIQKNRADIQYKKALSNGLAAQSSLAMTDDNIKAIRIAETAYKIGLPEPSPSVQQVLTTTAYSISDRPFYTFSNQYEDYVAAVTYSPKGTKILTLSLAGHAKLFDMEGKLLTDFSQPSIKINTAVFSPDGNYLITLSLDKMARLWDLKGNLLKTLNKHTDKVWGAVFSPDSFRILTFSDDKTAKLWDLNGNLLADLNKHTARVSHAAFSPIGDMIVTSSWDNTAKLWNLSGSLLADLKGHKDYVWNAVFSSDGSRLITASSDKTAKVWNLKGKLLHDLKFTDKVWSAALSNDGKTVLARVGNTAKLCDLAGNLIADLQRHKSDVSDALFSPTGSKILTSSGNSADLWDLKGSHLAGLGNQTDYISKVMFYNNDAGILTCSGNTVKLWDLEKSFVVDLNKSMGNVRNALFSPDKSKIITWSANTAKLFDSKGNLLAELKQHRAPILSVAFSPDNSQVLTGSWDNTAKLWDLKGNLLTDFNRHPAQVSAVAFMPDGNKILTVAQHNSAALWDLKGNLLEKLNINMDNVEKATLSPDGSKLLTWTGLGNNAQLWDLKGNLLATLKQHTDTVFSASFFPDGSRILTASRDNTVKLWDLRGNFLADLKRQTSSLAGAFLSPNGDRIITTSEDNTAKLWDLEGNLLADLNKNTSPVSTAVFIDNGKRILTVSKDGTLKRWHTPEAIMEELKTASIPKLSKEDKENLGIGEW